MLFDLVSEPVVPVLNALSAETLEADTTFGKNPFLHQIK